VGANGLAGTQGPQGPTGNVGAMGSTGNQGPSGDQGATGAPYGLTGTMGQTLYHNGTDWTATNNLYNNGPTGAITFNNAYTFPTADGTAGQVLQTDASGNVSWGTPAGGSDAWTDDGTVVRLTTAADRVGIGTSSPDASAQLEVTSTTKGLLPPRMTSSQRDGILNPAAGLVVFNITSQCLNYYSGTAWIATCGNLSSSGDNNNWVFDGGGDWNNQGLDSIHVNGDWLYVHPSDHASNPGVQWETTSNDISQVEDTDAGHTNTIIANILQSDVRAIEICDTSTISGFTDWFLPAKDELNIMVAKKDSLTNFTSGIYWSSTQYNSNSAYAWASNIATSDLVLAIKNSNYYNVRCVRRAIGGKGNVVPSFLYMGTPLYVHKVDNSDALRYEVVNSNIAGAIDEYDGPGNTQALAATSDADAAKLCDTLTAYGVTDWYLPARNELDAMYTHRYSIGGFDASAWYWSSTQHGNYAYAYARFFGPSSSSTAHIKNSFYHAVRCVTRSTP
jgi:hypothetical protein